MFLVHLKICNIFVNIALFCDCICCFAWWLSKMPLMMVDDDVIAGIALKLSGVFPKHAKITLKVIMMITGRWNMLEKPKKDKLNTYRTQSISRSTVLRESLEILIRKHEWGIYLHTLRFPFVKQKCMLRYNIRMQVSDNILINRASTVKDNRCILMVTVKAIVGTSTTW